jgi:alpha-tubulin suppressor-like RCC1 family protein
MWGEGTPEFRQISKSSVIQISCGMEHFALLTLTGQVYTFGGDFSFSFVL